VEFIILNTIGLTGVEAIQSRLSSLEHVLVLPSQNFTMFDQHLYRSHNYHSYSGDEVFRNLNKELCTKDGRIWMGLRKYMTREMTEKYDLDKHKRIFLRQLGGKRDFSHCLRCYASSYFETMSPDLYSKAKYVVIYSANVALNSSFYEDYITDFRIWNVHNEIDIWLASISQSRTWNCHEACKYWLVNNLYLDYFSKTKGNQYQSFNWTDIVTDPKSVLVEIAKELGVHLNEKAEHDPGIIQPSKEFENKLLNDAKILRKIYSNTPLFKLADSFSEWSQLAIADKRIIRLLEEYVQFWNTTGHTNFDWVGPIADQIIDRLKFYCNEEFEEINYSYEFYHVYFQTNSDNYLNVQGSLQHYLGDLENKIELPFLPYYLRIVIFYLKMVAENYIFHAHSYIPIKRSSLYKRLASKSGLQALEQHRLTNEYQELEILIDKAESACSHLKA